jgi:beta-fructofuranosidase
VTSITRTRHPDPAFPRLHGRPDHGWVNDPHGCAYIDGRYHVFFQHNPVAPHHNEIKWGHISSTDLVHWRQEPIALVNRPGELDEYGCWTGCVIDDHGVPTAIYSAVADASHDAAVLLARSDRQMRTWQQLREPVAPTPADPAISHARDPFVFDVDGHRYAVQGAGHCSDPGAARVLVYGCEDLTSWTELGTLVSIDDPVAAKVAPAYIWECPNLVRIDDRWVLIVSLWTFVDGTHVLDGVAYLVGDLQVERGGPRFTPTSGGRLDRGHCFYAPQVLSQDGRTLVWGWAQEHGRSQDDIEEAGWAGALTFCRELLLVDGVLLSRPAPEVAALRREALHVIAGEPFTAAAFDIEPGSDAGHASLCLVDGSDERLVAEFDLSAAPTVRPRILVDGSIVEIFDGSATPLTTRAYPTATSAWILRLARPAPIAAWTLDL